MHREVVIIGGNHHNTLSVLRSLGRKDIFANLILSTKEVNPMVAKSKYIKKLILVKDDNEILTSLIENFATLNHKPIVIACYDFASSLLDMNYSLLESKFILPGAKCQGVITKYMDKQMMSTLAQDNGLTIPNTCTKNDIIEKNISYPIIIKPLVSKNGSKAEISICDNIEQLSKYFLLHPNVDVQIQQYIEKEYEYQLIGCSISGGKDIIIPGRTLIIHQPKNTNTAFLRYEELVGNEPVDCCKRFIKTIGYSGLFSMEFLRGKDGTDYFMEINFRNDGNAISVTDAGVNLPYIWYLGSQGLDFSSELKRIRTIYVMPETVVIGLWVKGIINFRQLFRDFMLKDISMDYDPNDPAPTSGKRTYMRQLFLAIMIVMKQKLLCKR